jgi:hypothetical protein
MRLEERGELLERFNRKWAVPDYVISALALARRALVS